MLLYIMRHGETDYNAKGRAQGWTDIPLNENGRELAKMAAEGGMKEIPFDLIISSPLGRAVESAKLVTGGKEIPMILDERIKEINFGDWDGMTSAEIKESKADSEEERMMWTKPYQFKGIPGGESILDVIARTKDFFEELIQNPEYEDKTILVSTHGCAMRGILHNVYEDKEDFWRGRVAPNYGVNIVSVENGQATLLEEDKVYYDPSFINDQYSKHLNKK